jgi:hypothetical protein
MFDDGYAAATADLLLAVTLVKRPGIEATIGNLLEFVTAWSRPRRTSPSRLYAVVSG